MKNLVVYYSLSGNTEVVAQEIAKLIEGDLKKIECIKEPGFVWAALSAMLGMKVKIKPLDFSVEEYDNVFVGGPVWAAKSCTPINTFLDKTDFKNKNVYIFLTQSDEKTPSTVFDSMKSRIQSDGGNIVDCFFVQTQMKSVISVETIKRPITNWIDKFKVNLFN